VRIPSKRKACTIARISLAKLISITGVLLRFNATDRMQGHKLSLSLHHISGINILVEIGSKLAIL